MLRQGQLDGIGRFSFEMLKRITRRNPEVHFVFLFDREVSEEFIFSDNITPIILWPQARHPILYRLWFEWSVRSLLNQMKPDLFFSPDGFLSLGAKCPQLPVIHDINFFHHPEDLRRSYSRYYNKFFPKFAKLAAQILTVSEYSKKDIAAHFKIESEKIQVAYNGISEGFYSRGELKNAATRNKFSNGNPYFLYVGSMHPRKNIVRLLIAFDAFKKSTGAPHSLVLCGPEFWGLKSIEAAHVSLKHKKDVIITGRIPEQDLQEIYSAAFAFVYVPYFEGFGIPLVEAMASEIPVITSNITSMPEVCADAALYVNPMNVEEISGAMTYLLNDSEKRIELVKKGTNRKNNFNWDAGADIVWDCIRSCVTPATSQR